MTYRMIESSMWLDPWFEEANTHEKLLFIYLFTNPYCNSAGAAQYSHKRLSDETGIPRDEIEPLLSKMKEAGKITSDGPWIATMAFIRHQTRNGNFGLSVDKALSEISSQMIRDELTKVKATLPQRETNPKQPRSKGGSFGVASRSKGGSSGVASRSKGGSSGLQDQGQDQGQEQKKENIVESGKPNSTDDKKPSVRKMAQITPEFIAECKATYPELDVDAEIRKMDLWLKLPNNTGKQRSKKRLTYWLSNAKPCRSFSKDAPGPKTNEPDPLFGGWSESKGYYVDGSYRKALDVLRLKYDNQYRQTGISSDWSKEDQDEYHRIEGIIKTHNLEIEKRG